ncbi:MAG TPA: 2Fe-2S iron-sulfur cluster-binding protein [Burkholderiales bacterium]|nr:2Fe-2S iron-sulfur cluster-binding protein [Burkholderiales bacterium]
MTFKVKIADSDIAFDCPQDKSILDAALEAGWELPYSCRRGACESCRARVVSGELAGPTALTGEALLCRAQPRSDVEIAPREIRRLDPTARKRIRAKLYRLERPAPDVASLHLRFPAGVRVKFRAGQYLEVILGDASRRAFSMANPPQQSDGALLHVRILPGGAFSDTVLGALKTGDALDVELPFGDFHLRESRKPAILLAGGTGFAPMKAIVEDVLRRGVERDIALYWGARRRSGLYAEALAQKWASQRPSFRFVPVLSEESWEGRSGLVHRAVMEDFPSLSGHEVYACGAPGMVEAARRELVAERGLPSDAFYCDPFAESGDSS